MCALFEFCQKLLDFLYYISPALVTVLLGGFILQKFFISRANEAALIDFLIRELDELRTLSLEYWNLDCSKDGKNEKSQRARVLEQQIKGAIKSLTGELKYYSERYCKKNDFPNLMVEVSDACTGGQFESAKKIADCSRYLVVVNTINRVKSELIRRKI
jgi:hypothetical protein